MRRPNLILILADDLGYNDLGCYGSAYSTPRIDRMSREGLKFNDFYVASPVCTPSRAAFMTGSWPKRVGMADRVLFPNDRGGLHPRNWNMAQSLKESGYNTALIGKWHLGHEDHLLPHHQGFDLHYGLPYSNDMPSNDLRTTLAFFHALPVWVLDQAWRRAPHSGRWWQPPLIKNGEVLEQPANQEELTDSYTREAVRYVETHARDEKPFFLFVSHNDPHVPIFLPEHKRKGRDARDAYRLAIEHLDDSTGQILDAVDNADIANNTMVVFVSDNGPWVRMKHHAGSSKPFRDGKRTVYEGGVRVPCVARMPGTIPAGTTSSEIGTSMDFFPTFAELGGARCHEGTERPIDGKSLTRVLKEPDTATSPHDCFLYFDDKGTAQGIREGNFKMLNNQLYDLDAARHGLDPEARSVKSQYRDTYQRLNQVLKQRADEVQLHPSAVS